jgi:hypothetical protein
VYPESPKTKTPIPSGGVTVSRSEPEIQAWARRQFDPEVVGVFMKIPDLVFEDMRREIKADSGEARL